MIMHKRVQSLLFIAAMGFPGVSNAWTNAWTDVFYALGYTEYGTPSWSTGLTHVQSHTAPVSTSRSIGIASATAYAAPGILKASMWAVSDSDPEPYPHPVGRSSSVHTGASFFDFITLNPPNPALVGQAVTVNASWLLTGDMLAIWNLLNNLPATASASTKLFFNGTGVGRWGVQAREQHGYRAGSFYDISIPAPMVIPVSISATFGSRTGIQYGLDLQGVAETGFLKEECLHDCGFSSASAELTANYGNSLVWGGISSVIDANGNPIVGFTVSSDSGFNYAQAVPEPGTWTMLLAGVGLLGWLARHKGT
jgi:hypothetical protein